MVSATVFAVDKKLTSVNVTPLSKILVTTKNSAPANIISLNNSTISAEITGRALKIHAEAGDLVEEGQELVSLDCRSYTLAKKQADAALKVASTQLDLAKKQLKRNRRLIKNGTIPREIYDRTEAAEKTSLADIELKKAAIETSLLAIDRCSIKAPFAGQITKRKVQQGQLVMASTPLFQLMQNDTMEIKTNISASDVTKLKNSPQLEFVAGDSRFKATVRSIIQTIDESTRTQEVRLSLSNGSKVAAGLSGRVEWSSNELQIPAEYILRKNAQLGVMVAEDIVEGTGKARFVALNNAIEGQPVVTNLPANTAIISKNQFRVNDGELISIQ